MLWNLKQLIESANTDAAEIEGEWVPARPINYKVESIWERIHNAWLVFRGKADAVKWPKGQ